VIQMQEETTSTNAKIGDEVNKGSDLSEIKKIHKREPPIREVENLTDQELLAVIVTGHHKGKAFNVAANVLNTFESNLIHVFCASVEQLMQIEGITFSRACQIKAAFELMKRIESYFKEEHPVIASTDEVVHLLGPHMQFLKQEEFRVILLDSKKRLIRHCQVSLGSLDQTIVHPREVFRPAVAGGAAFIVLAHNHPSGDPTPSEYDVLLTQKLCMSGKILGIEVLEHVVIGFRDHLSFKDEGLM